MSLFTLIKITRTRYLLGTKQVKPGTPGAVKVNETSRYWYAYRRDGNRQIKVRLFTDRAASLTRLAKMNTAIERGEAEMTDPRKEHLDRPAVEHLNDFIPVMRARGKSEKDKDRKPGTPNPQQQERNDQQSENDKKSEKPMPPAGTGEGAGGQRNAPNAAESWGSLPPKQAREVIDAKRREPPQQWRKQIEDYFRKLAETKK